MEREQATFTLRIPEDKSERLKALSKEIGMSQNSLILAFIQIGLDSYEEAISLNQAEFRRFLSQRN